MTQALFCAFILLAAPGEPQAVEPLAEVQLKEALRQFNRGDFQGALKTLEAAGSQTTDDATLSRIHLLAGQCFAARQDFAHAEQAFALALRHDPEATLDPFKVDPAVVRLLESLRGRLKGRLAVTADHEPAEASLDGKHLGAVPLQTVAPIGRHLLEIRTTDGRHGARQQVVIRPDRQTTAALKLIPLPPEGHGSKSAPGNRPAGPTGDAVRAFADLRTAIAPAASSEVVGFEVGGGVESGPLRGSLHANLYPSFGFTLRGAAGLPVNELLRLFVSVEAPMLFDGAKIGFGGAAGAEYSVGSWFAVFSEIGARHFFTGFVGEPNRFVLQAGTRMRLP